MFGEPSPHDPPTLVLCPGARYPPSGLPPWEQPRLCLPGALFKNAIVAGPETSALPLPTWRLWEGRLCPPGLTDAFPGQECAPGASAQDRRELPGRFVLRQTGGWAQGLAGPGAVRGWDRMSHAQGGPSACLHGFIMHGRSSEKVQDEGPPSKASPKCSHQTSVCSLLEAESRTQGAGFGTGQQCVPHSLSPGLVFCSRINSDASSLRGSILTPWIHSSGLDSLPRESARR